MKHITETAQVAITELMPINPSALRTAMEVFLTDWDRSVPDEDIIFELSDGAECLQHDIKVVRWFISADPSAIADHIINLAVVITDLINKENNQ